MRNNHQIIIINKSFHQQRNAKSYINSHFDPLITMNKRINFMFTIAAIAVMGGALFGGTFTAQLMLVHFRKFKKWAV